MSEFASRGGDVDGVGEMAGLSKDGVGRAERRTGAGKGDVELECGNVWRSG